MTETQLDPVSVGSEGPGSALPYRRRYATADKYQKGLLLSDRLQDAEDNAFTERRRNPIASSMC